MSITITHNQRHTYTHTHNKTLLHLQVQHVQKQLQRIRRTTVHVLQQRIVRLRRDVRRAKKKYKNVNKNLISNRSTKPDADTATASDTGNDSTLDVKEQFGPEIIASKDEDIAKLAQVGVRIHMHPTYTLHAFELHCITQFNLCAP